MGNRPSKIKQLAKIENVEGKGKSKAKILCGREEVKRVIKLKQRKIKKNKNKIKKEVIKNLEKNNCTKIEVSKIAEKVGVSDKFCEREIEAMKKETGPKSFKQLFEFNLSKEQLAKNFVDNLFKYNLEKVNKKNQFGDYEELRDAQTAMRAAKFMADFFESPSNNISINNQINQFNLNTNTSFLAVKQLILMINTIDELKEIQELLELQIDRCLKIVG
jgi:hypothetical protein